MKNKMLQISSVFLISLFMLSSLPASSVWNPGPQPSYSVYFGSLPSLTTSSSATVYLYANRASTLRIYQNIVLIKTCYSSTSCSKGVYLQSGSNAFYGSGTYGSQSDSASKTVNRYIVQMTSYYDVVSSSTISVSITASYSSTFSIYMNGELIDSKPSGTIFTLDVEIPDALAFYDVEVKGSASPNGYSTVIEKSDTFFYVPDDDIVRNDYNSEIYTLKVEVYEYTETWYPETISGSIGTVPERITALENFARDVLNPMYPDLESEELVDLNSDAMKAWEMAEEFNNNGFDGLHDYREASWATDPFKTGRGYDCRDMAALIAGLAKSMALKSRIVSLYLVENKNSFEHIFTEVYGLTIGGEKAWTLIDPGHPYREFYDHNNMDDIKARFSRDGFVDRFWLVGGWDTAEEEGWGRNFTGFQQTAWGSQSYANPPIVVNYSDINPYGIVSRDDPSD